MKKCKLLAGILVLGMLCGTELSTYAKETDLNNNFIVAKPNAIKPVADFVFNQVAYTEGQEVKVLNASYGQNGRGIVKGIWMVNWNPSTKTNKLSRIFGKPKPGTYLISLKVKDERGIWSDWITKPITISPNQKPVITEMKSDKETYERGEDINLTYAYTNEEWEPIIKERWTYRGGGEDKAVANPMKPDKIFDPGEYIVTLSLEDTNGNISDVMEYTLKIEDKVQKYEYRYKFDKAWPGSIIDNMKNFNFKDYKEIEPESITQVEGKLIMSNSPEQVNRKGILYQDNVSGQGRVIIHHINHFSDESNKAQNKKLVVIAQNKSTEPIVLKIKNKSIKGPVYDVLTSGQEVLKLYLLNSPQVQEYLLPPGKKVKLYDSAPAVWQRGRIISGLFDFEATGKVTFTSAITDSQKTLADTLAMPILPKDPLHKRGTFDIISLQYIVDLSEYNEPVSLIIGNKGKDEWAHGTDATSGQEIHNAGNYGISHYITVKAKDKTGIFLNPRGGVYRGIIGWDDNKQLITTPLYGSFTQPVRAATLGVVAGGESKTFEYILSNGSAAPILFGFIPESYWDKEIGQK